MNKDNFQKYHWQGMTSSDGMLELNLYFPSNKVTKTQKESALAEAIRQSHDFMLSKGYLLPDSRFMSPSDIANEHGHTRQYWEKLLNEGKIPYKETSAGRITTDLWVRGYLNNKEKVDLYIRDRNKIVDIILSQKKKWGQVECPNCGEPRFDYAINTNNINGLCRAGCGFRIHTTI